MIAEEWVLPAAMILASDGNPRAVIARAQQRGIGATEIEAALWQAVDKAAERGDDELPEVHDYAAVPPGSLDLRVFDQGEVWVDVLRVPHTISEISDEYVLNLIAWNRRWAESNHAAYTSRWNVRAAALGPVEWIQQIPLYLALVDEVVRRGL